MRRVSDLTSHILFRSLTFLSYFCLLLFSVCFFCFLWFIIILHLNEQPVLYCIPAHCCLLRILLSTQHRPTPAYHPLCRIINNQHFRARKGNPEKLRMQALDIMFQQYNKQIRNKRVLSITKHNRWLQQTYNKRW